MGRSAIAHKALRLKPVDHSNNFLPVPRIIPVTNGFYLAVEALQEMSPESVAFEICGGSKVLRHQYSRLNLRSQSLQTCCSVYRRTYNGKRKSSCRADVSVHDIADVDSHSCSKWRSIVSRC